MSKLFFFTIFMIGVSAVSFGVLGINFDIIAQALGVFDKDTAVLIGCDCVDTSGNTVPCDDTNSVVTGEPLCPTSPSTNP